LRYDRRKQGVCGFALYLSLTLVLCGLAVAFAPLPAHAEGTVNSSLLKEMSASLEERAIPGNDSVGQTGSNDQGTGKAGKKANGSEVLKVEVNHSVSRYLRIYQSHCRESLLKDIRKAEAYLAQVKTVFEKAGLPVELCNLAFIESGFDPHAYSRVGAVGFWQFMKETAKLFGLRVNWWVDERRDPEKSTHAATQYLKQLHRTFGSWPLAIAAYNAGEDRVLEAVRNRPQADFWSLQIPRESRELVSAFMAVTLILRDPETYYFPRIRENSPRYVRVPVDSCTDLRVIAKACNVPLGEILALNPELNWGCTPPDQSPYRVRIPAETKARFREVLSRIPPEDRIVWARHQVRKGDTLSQISKRYRVPIPMIVQMNHLPSFQSLPAGKDLLLPIPQGFRETVAVGARIPAQQAETQQAETASSAENSTSHSVHVVQQGDTLSKIARSYGVSVKELLQTNGLQSSAVIQPGDRLRIPEDWSL